MQEQELKTLVQDILRQKTEKQTIELKACHNGFPKRIYDTLSSFSNQDGGGIIIFGVAEAEDFEIVGVYDVVDAQKKAMEACGQMEPKVRAVFTCCEIDGKMVLSAEIPGVDISQRPVFYAGVGRIKGAYVRVGDADEPMSEYEIYSYEAFRRRIRDELRPVPEAKINLFDQGRLESYLSLVKQERPNLSRNVADADILELMGVTVNGIPTLAGVLTFSLYPQTWFPQLCITAISVPGTEIGETDDDGARFLDNRRITGAIPEMLDAGVEFVRKNIRVKTIITEEGKRSDRPEYPLKAVREAILNALLHRDYSIYTENTPISIEIYHDRMCVISKGGLYGGGSIKQLGNTRLETRNPVLANMLEILKVTENRYSGIPTIYRELRNANLPEPEFDVKRGSFSIIFRKHSDPSGYEIDKTNLTLAILEFCKTPRSREELTKFTGKSRYYTMSAIVQPLIDTGKLRLTIAQKPKSPYQRYVTVR